MKSEIEAIQEQIRKTEVIVTESRVNLKENPDSYSAKLLLMSVETHLGDLLKKLDNVKEQED